MFLKFLQNIRIQAILVFLVAVLQYANTCNHDYAWDDAIVITENTRVQKGLKNVPELFENIKTNETQNRYGYRPLTLLSFATDVELFGMDPKPAHKVNVFLYAILCVLVLLFLHRLFGQYSIGVFLVTLVFAVHPLHTEVVANIKSRDEILALGFGLVALIFYVRCLSGSIWKNALASLLFFMFGFLSKESAVVLIGVAFIMPWVISGNDDMRVNLSKSLPLVVFFAVLLGIRMFVYSDMFFESNDFELQEKGIFLQDGYVGNPLFDSGISERLATAVYLVPYFVYRFFFPHPLLHDYSFDQFAVRNFNEPVVWFSALAIILIIALTFYGLLKRNPIGFGGAFFLFSTSIYLHLAQIAPDIFAERFVFVPSLGLCVMLLHLFDFTQVKRAATLAICMLLIPMFVYSRQRNGAWENNRKLLETDMPRLTRCVRANYNYALLLHANYYALPEDERSGTADSILYYYEHTMTLTDRLFNVYMDLGSAYMEFGKPDSALKVFTDASVKYGYLSIPWVQIGKYHMSFQQYAKAVPYFKRAMKQGEKNSDYHYLLSICLFNSGWHREAMETLYTGEQLGVSSSAYYDLIARFHVAMGEDELAREALRKGLTIFKNDPGLQQRLDNLSSPANKQAQ